MSQKFESFGKYILLEKLATGGMAEVFLCRKNGADGIGKFCAIKRILPQFADSPEFIDMFRDEAKIAINLSHSNIVSIHEFGVESSQFYIVMDYVEGRNLRQVLNKMKKTSGRLSIDQIVYVVKEVAAGLDHAHRCLDETTGKPLNITHRDMSPQNVMLSFEGEIKIVDFGIAKAESQMETTRAGTLKGKFGYMSPEQAEGQNVDLRTDIFSLGIVLWELLANDRLFIANNEINTLRKIRDCQIPSLRKINPNIPSELDRIVQKSLARDRNLRYQTAAALHRDLSRFLNRQFPDFSPHDFSVFIKTIFQDEILNTRKRIIEYANLPLKDGAVNNVESLRSATSTDASISGTQTTSFVSSKSVNQLAPDSFPSKEKNSSPLSLSEGKEESSDSFVDLKSLASLGKPAATSSPTDNDPTQYIPSKPNPSVVLDEDALSKGLKKEMSPAATSSFSIQTDEFTLGSSTNTRYRSKSRGTKSSSRSRRKRPFNFFSAALTLALVVSTYALAVKFMPRQMQPIVTVTDPFIAPLHRFLGVGLAADYSSQRSPAETESAKPAPPEAKEPKITAPELGEAEKPSPPPQPPKETAANDETLEIVVTSAPSGAEIYINGKNTQLLTPSKVNIPAKGAFSIELKRSGYIEYVQENLVAANLGVKYAATLQKALIGYIDIDVRPPTNAIIFINGQRLKENRLPINRYPIPANTNVKVRVENPALGLSEEKIVNIAPDRRSSVLLNLRNSQRKPARK